MVLDCRWLGIGGPGRTTEFVLRGLAQVPPEGRWRLWGPAEATGALAWPGASVEAIEEDPRALLGQRRGWEMPTGDFYVFMHQQRPLRNLPSATVIYDTIALRYGSNRPVRHLKRRFLKRVANISRRVLTISRHSQATILRDLDVPAERVDILRFPFDDAFVDRVLAHSAATSRADTALFIGGFLAHKNLARLLQAFGDTEFCRTGGRLVLVGGSPKQASDLLGRLDVRTRAFVTVHHSCTQDDIDRLYATSLFLVQPSLEEGFGLPAWEAMSCGLPICVSDGGSLPEVTAGFADPFPATSVPAMTTAIDRCAESARLSPDARAAMSARVRASAPTVRDFGSHFGEIIARSARPR